MNNTILLGRGRQIVELSRSVWEQHLAQAPGRHAARLAFMSTDHHRVRAWVVREIPRQPAPIPAETIARALDLPEARVTAILDELERNLFFLVRNAQGAVSWAFPVTRDATPHRLDFSSGEQCYAA